MLTHVIHPFSPVFDQNSRVLILGSFPSVRSRADGFYYGHPRNRFWPMLAAIYGETQPQTIVQKQALLARHGIALWDVIAECDITGSSDASVRNAVPVDILHILSTAPVARIICNGALAGRLYQKHLTPVTGTEAIVLPSTSPANAAWSLDRLVEAWRPALL